MAINFEEKDIEFIITNIVAPCLTEYSNQLAEIYNKNSDSELKVMETIVDSVSSRIRKLEIENSRNIHFIKAVLFQHKLSNQECYEKYIDEWNRLNSDIIE